MASIATTPTSEAPFRIERRYGVVMKSLVFAALTMFVVCDGVAIWISWRDGLTGWLVGSILFGVLFVFAWVMFLHRYVIRGVNGHYVELRDHRLVLGEVDGRIVQDVDLDEITRIHYDHGNEMSTRVECRERRAFTLNTVEIEPEEFDALAEALARKAPSIVIERA